MRITVDMDLDDLADKMCCPDTIDCLREIFTDGDLESVLEDILDGTDIEDVEQTIKDEIFKILAGLVPDDRPLTKDDVSSLEEAFYPDVTAETLRANNIPVEGPLRDENGEYELVPAEDPRQMTLFDESGLSPPMKKRYIESEE